MAPFELASNIDFLLLVHLFVGDLHPSGASVVHRRYHTTQPSIGIHSSFAMPRIFAVAGGVSVEEEPIKNSKS